MSRVTLSLSLPHQSTYSSRLGEISPVPSILCADVLMMDKPEKPRAKFIFWYRPLGKYLRIQHISDHLTTNAIAILQAEGILPLPLRLDDRQARKRPRTDSPSCLSNQSDGQSSSKRMKPDPTGLVYGTMDDIWQASLLLKPAYLNDQDLNLELIDEELETLKVRCCLDPCGVTLWW